MVDAEVVGPNPALLWARGAVVLVEGGRKKALAWRGPLEQQQAKAAAAATAVVVDTLLRRDVVCLVTAVAADIGAGGDGVFCNILPALIIVEGESLRRQVWEL